MKLNNKKGCSKMELTTEECCARFKEIERQCQTAFLSIGEERHFYSSTGQTRLAFRSDLNNIKQTNMKERITDKDKIQHFVVCLVAAILHPMFAIGLALGKEFGDSKAAGNHWCWLDLLADAIGTAIGGIIWWLLWYKIIN